MTNEPSEATATTGFMGSIWKITLISMIGTACIGFAIHLAALDQRHKENMQQIAKVEYRTKQYAAYRDIYKQSGKAAADATLTNK